MKDPEKRCEEPERRVEKLENFVDAMKTEPYRPKATLPAVKRAVGRLLLELRKGE
jgi:hypothetical protein